MTTATAGPPPREPERRRDGRTRAALPGDAAADRVVILLAYLLGAGSLVLFFLGPRGCIDLRLTDGGALAWDAGLSIAFFAQHSIMIRRTVKARLARLFPAHYLAAIYAITSGVVLGAVSLLWQPTGSRLATVERPVRVAALALVALALAGFGWGIATLRRSFDPLGIRAIRAHRRGRPDRPPALVARGPYRWVRHPLYLFALVILWAPVDPGADRLLLAALWSAWIVAGTLLEERDLVAEMGEPYRAYQRAVPMLLPWRSGSLSRRSASSSR